jgi:GT2 family glycosyltransferase
LSFLTASIVIYNNINQVQDLLNDLLIYDGNIRVFVIDNSEESNAKHFSNIDKVEYKFNNKNLGYGSAHNIAINKSIQLGSDYHVILNPDIRFNQGTLSSLVNFMNSNPEIGMCSPKVLFPNGDLQYLCKLIPEPKNLMIRRFLPSKKITSKHDNNYELRSFSYNRNIEIPYISGCFMFARTSILEKVNGFDERFFLYFEDLDLTRRIGKISKTYFFSETFVYHGYNKESYRSNKVLIHHIKNAIKYFNKWGWFFDKEREKVNKRTLLQLDK